MFNGAGVALSLFGLGCVLTVALRAPTWTHYGVRLGALAIAVVALLSWRDVFPEHQALYLLVLLAFPLVGAADEVLERVRPAFARELPEREPGARIRTSSAVWGLRLGIVALALVGVGFAGFFVDVSVAAALIPLAILCGVVGVVVSAVGLARGPRRGVAAAGLALSLIPAVAVGGVILWLVWVFSEGGFD